MLNIKMLNIVAGQIALSLNTYDIYTLQILNILAGQIALSWRFVVWLCTLPHNIQHIQGK